MEETDKQPENYVLKIKYELYHKEKILQLFAESKIEYEELNSKYAENWLLVKQQISDDKISELEKKLKEFGEGVVVEKIKKYSINEEPKP